MMQRFHEWRTSNSLSARTVRTGTQVLVAAWVATGAALDGLADADMWSGVAAAMILYLLMAVGNADNGAALDDAGE